MRRPELVQHHVERLRADQLTRVDDLRPGGQHRDASRDLRHPAHPGNGGPEPERGERLREWHATLHHLRHARTAHEVEERRQRRLAQIEVDQRDRPSGSPRAMARFAMVVDFPRPEQRSSSSALARARRRSRSRRWSAGSESPRRRPRTARRAWPGARRRAAAARASAGAPAAGARALARSPLPSGFAPVERVLQQSDRHAGEETQHESERCVVDRPGRAWVASNAGATTVAGACRSSRVRRFWIFSCRSRKSTPPVAPCSRSSSRRPSSSRRAGRPSRVGVSACTR